MKACRYKKFRYSPFNLRSLRYTFLKNLNNSALIFIAYRSFMSLNIPL